MKVVKGKPVLVKDLPKPDPVIEAEVMAQPITKLTPRTYVATTTTIEINAINGVTDAMWDLESLTYDISVTIIE